MTVAFTGHRPNKMGNDYDLVSPLIQRIKKDILDLFEIHQPKLIITGMALGIDTLAAKIAVEENIPFIAAIPDTMQSSMWPTKSKKLYYELLGKAKEIVNVSKSEMYAATHMQLRNEWMVTNSNRLIAVWNGDKKGGTWNCIRYAEDRYHTIDYIMINNESNTKEHNA